MKLSDWAKKQGICYQTAYNWFKAGKIKNATQIDTGTIIIQETNEIEENIVLYARVSNQSRKKELNYQIDRLRQFAILNGYNTHKVYKEVASGMNDNRTQFWKMIENKPSHIIVENKYRLTRFGFNYLERLLTKLGCTIIVVHQDDNDETDLMKDLVSIITSFCCRLYGLRRGQNKAKTLTEELNK